MQKLLIVLLSLGSVVSYACSCDFDYDESKRFKSAYPSEAVKSIIQNKLGLTSTEETEISYTQTLFERFLGKPGSNSCLGESADGKTIHQCNQKYTGVLKATIAEQNCEVLVQVKRRKYKTVSKILSHNCEIN